MNQADAHFAGCVRIAVWFRCSLNKQTVSGNKVYLVSARSYIR